MKVRHVVACVLSCLAVASLVLPAIANRQGDRAKQGPVVIPKASYEARTVIAPSAIPGAGNGLFARVRIAKGEIIGELGGRLLAEPDPKNGSEYLAGLPECALARVKPYIYIDSKFLGGHVSRINFAPRLINGKETGFQNSRIERVCESPYVIWTATQDIEPGTEIWSSYGPDYNYDRFMDIPEVRDFFCGRAGIDCRDKFEYDH